MKTIFKRPLFVNPQAYTTIPELYSIDKLQSFNFDENDTYTTKLVYNGRVESIIKKAGEEHILHLDLYTVDGSCVLGEWYVKGIDSESVVTIDKNILTIVANNNLKYPGLIAAWSAKGKTNEDVDRNILKDLTGNGHDITLNNFAWNTESGYSNPKYPDALVFDGVDDYGVNESLPSLTDYTVISKIYWITSPNAAVYAYGKSASKDNPAYTVFSSYSSIGREISHLYNFGHDNGVKPYINPIINYHNTKVFNETPIKKGSVIDDNYPLHLGKIWATHNGLCNMAFYSFYLFNRTLTDQEIKSFIRKHIDPEYLLPSEIPATTLISNDTLIDNSTLIKNN